MTQPEKRARKYDALYVLDILLGGLSQNYSAIRVVIN